MRITACPGFWNCCPTVAGPAAVFTADVAVAQLRGISAIVVRIPDQLGCGFLGPFSIVLSSCSCRVQLQASSSQPLNQDPNITTGLRAGSTNRCSEHVVPKVVCYQGPSTFCPFFLGVLASLPMLVCPWGPFSICDWVRAEQLPCWPRCFTIWRRLLSMPTRPHAV